MFAYKKGVYEVINGFIDSNTGTAYSIGDTYECKKKRFEEIQKKGDFLREIPVDQPETENE